MPDELVFATDRSRAEEHHRCHRGRWWAYEFRRRGLARARVSIPLARGTAFHVAAARLEQRAMQDEETAGTPIRSEWVEEAVAAGVGELERMVGRTGFEDAHSTVDQVNAEQRHLVEAMVRIYARRGLPAILGSARLIQVEQDHVAPLGRSARIWPASGSRNGSFRVPANASIRFMSRPDAVLLTDEHDIETLSLKTTTGWDSRKLPDAAHSMQNFSEPWAVNVWLTDVWNQVRAGRAGDAVPKLLLEHLKSVPNPPSVASTRMVFITTGERRELAAAPTEWTSVSPLVRGYRRSVGRLRYEYAWAPYWRCGEPHGMPKNNWYPDGRCPGQRRHKLPDDFEQFAVWQDEEIGGVAGWIDQLDRTLIQPEAGDALAQHIVILPPIVRHQSDIDRWHRQISAQEAQVAEDSWHAKQLLDAGRLDEFDQFLDERFPMHTRSCDYPGRCPFQELCWNPEAARDPLATGLYLPRPAHHEMERQQLEPADAAA